MRRPGRVGRERDLLVSVDVPEAHGRDLAIAHRLSVELLLVGDREERRILRIGHDRCLAKKAQWREEVGLGAPTADVQPRDRAGIGRRGRERRRLWRRLREIPVHECVEQDPACAAVPIFGAPGAVVGHEETDIRIEDEVQVASGTIACRRRGRRCDDRSATLRRSRGPSRACPRANPFAGCASSARSPVAGSARCRTCHSADARS